MIIEIKAPSPGESIPEVEIAKWFVEDNDIVTKEDNIVEIESDKATLNLTAEQSGKIKKISPEGTTVQVGEIIGTIDTSFQPSETKEKKISTTEEKNKKPIQETVPDNLNKIKITPLAEKKMKTHNFSVEDILYGLRKITKDDVEIVLKENQQLTSSKLPKQPFSREDHREKMSVLRRKLSQRLVAVKNETAMLTTFNEIDMTNVIAMRKKYGKQFQEKHTIKLGFMSLFTKAAAIALQLHPNVNAAMTNGEELIQFEYSDIGIAVQTPKGLMVPIIRNAESLRIDEIEKEIKKLAHKARTKTISIEEITGGTFTITNGGVFGSLLSTPILNPPQSAILGMHNIVERPVAINGKVEIRPMMYVALSYDHRIIDGKDSVGFLIKIKKMIETPYKMLIEGGNENEILLGLE